VAVCGRNIQNVRELAKSCGARAYSELPSFFDHRPMEAVLIGSPSGLHSPQGIEAARHGLAVLTEKPLAIDVRQADSLIEACDRARVKLGVFFQDRCAPDLQNLKTLISDGRLGKPLLATASVKWHRPAEYYSESRWRGTWALDGGGALMNQGIHTADLLLWYFGEVRRVWAKAATAAHRIEVEDTVVAALEFENGAVGTIEATTAAYPGYPRRLELTGTEGTVVVEGDRVVRADLRNQQQPFESAASASSPGATGSEARAVSPVVSDASGHRRILEDFLDAMVLDRPPICDGREGRRSVRLVEAIYEASRTGRS
jgi:predicted dehydrogenase